MQGLVGVLRLSVELPCLIEQQDPMYLQVAMQTGVESILPYTPSPYYGINRNFSRLVLKYRELCNVSPRPCCSFIDQY